MGLAESSTAKSYSHFIRSYVEVTHLSHEAFGDVRILEHRSRKGELVLEKVFSFSDEGSYQHALKVVELKAATKWPFYCKILAYYSATQWGCMQGGFMIRLAVEYFDKSVFQASLKGSQVPENQTAMDENAAWRILSAMSQLCALFKRYELSLGPISSENVLLTSNDEVRLLDMGLMTFSVSIFDRLKRPYLLTNFAVSPEQLEQVRNGSNHPIDAERTDVFCIGMFVLCACLNEPIKTFYDHSTHEVQFELVFKKIMKLKKALFSDDFTDILVSTLQKEAELRPDAKTLHLNVQHLLAQPRNSMRLSITQAPGERTAGDWQVREV